MNKSLIARVAIFVLLVLLIINGIQAYKYSQNYQSQISKLTHSMEIDSQIKSNIHNFISKISFGLYNNTNQKNIIKLNQKQKIYKVQTQKYTFYYAICLLLLVLMYFVLPPKEFIIAICLSLFGTLFLGLFLPIMTIIIQKEINIIGNIVLSYESKSIIGSISKLYQNNKIVAFIILLFSIILPTFKILYILLITIFSHNKYTQIMIKTLKHIGKWSMADVFVVAILLVYLSMNGSQESDTNIEIGFYFFFMYVVGSMIVTLVSDKMLHQTKNLTSTP